MEVMYKVCVQLFSKTIIPQKRNASMSNNSNKQQWYDAECKILRSNFYSYLNIFRIEKKGKLISATY